MSLLNIVNSPWAIHPDKLQVIREVYFSHVSGKKIDIQAVENQLGRKLDSKHSPYAVQNGVAIIPIHGVMGKKMNLFSEISGGVSTQLVAKDIISAVEDPAVRSILLHIDSPGGTVDGTQALADVVRAAGEEKPIVSFIDGTMASAAYWVGSAAHEIISSSDTNQIGSIGVVTSHTDISAAEEKEGIKTTEISAGRYKRIASQHQPLSAEGAEVLQDQVDQIYSIFVDDVARNRGVSTDVVLQDMADGRVFLSEQAMRRGMIDGIASLEETIFNLSKGINQMTKKAQSQESGQALATDEGKITQVVAPVITLDNIKADYPEIVTALINEGATKERERIQACENACLPGHEALVNSMKFDGKSSDADIALAIVDAEKKIRASNLHDFSANAPEPLPHAPVNEGGSAPASAALPLEERAKAEFDASEDLQKEYKKFSTYLAFRKVQQANAKH